MQLSHTPHNDFFGQVMTRKGMAQVFFNRFMPADIRARADMSQLALVEGKHISDDGTTIYNDLLYKVPLDKGQVAYLYLMSEHQRTPYKYMPTRLMKYDVGAHEDCQKQGFKHMPIIVHFVFYNGAKPWPYSTALTDYYADPELGAKYLYMAPFILIDVPSYLPADIEQDTELGFCFASFKASTTKDPYQAFEQFMQVASFEEHIRGLPADLKNIVTWYLAHLVDYEKRGLKDVIHLVSANEQEEEKIMTSIADAYKQQYTHQGMQQGMEQGMEQGRQQEKTQIAQNMLQLHLPSDVVQQVTGLAKEEVAKLAR